MLTATAVQEGLKELHYYQGAMNGDLRGELTRDALKKFQQDHGLVADGLYGPKTDAVLSRLIAAAGPVPLAECRAFRLTTYYIAEEAPGGKKTTPCPDVNGKTLRMLSAQEYAEAALEGTIKAADGRMLNVAGKVVSVKASDYAGVYEIAQRNKWIPDKAGYAGLRLNKDGVVVAVSAFAPVPPGRVGVGYGTGKLSMPYTPFRTLAADIGAYKTSDPRYRGKGGLVPPGTKVWIADFVGAVLPDGTTHDGWFTVNDTGGAIFGAHFDVFTGAKALYQAFMAKNKRWPSQGKVWFEGIASRVPASYTYGLTK